MSLWGLVDFPAPRTEQQILYEIPNFYLEFLISELPIPVAPWRSVQNGPNAFVTECFVDEMAHAAGKDPLEFRLALLKKSKRAQRVLQIAARKGRLGQAFTQGTRPGHCAAPLLWNGCRPGGRGCSEREGRQRKGQPGCCRCGLRPGSAIPDPGGSPNSGSCYQCSEHGVEGGSQILQWWRVNPLILTTMTILRMSEVPEIEVHIVKSSEKIGGIGEPGVPPLAPAVANAFFNATGVRVRRIPLTPKFVQEALKKA